MRQLIQTQDGKILFTLGAIAVAMMIDFLTGTVAAKLTPTLILGAKRINGILRKICSIALMIFFIPLSIYCQMIQE
ncbi:phage holin family protein [Streptococcus equi]|uniref:phage holin family protein n=1 Tax=Streptococcus equi TaxID=1336 RepID=UPI0039C6381B